MIMILLSLAGGVLLSLAALAIYSYIYPLVLAKIILAAFLQL